MGQETTETSNWVIPNPDMRKLELDECSESGIDDFQKSRHQSPMIVENMVQDLVEQGVTEVPARFIRPPHQRATSRAQTSDEDCLGGRPEIPVVDMAPLVAVGDDQDLQEKQSSVKADISHACERFGFVQVLNHGVPASLMDAAMEMSQKFFAMSAEEKAVYGLKEPSGVGYGRLFETKDTVVSDWVDRMNMFLRPSRELREQYPLVITNPPGFHEVMDQYGKALNQLALKVLAILSEQIDQPPDFFFHKLEGGRAGLALRMNMNYYPPCPQSDLVMGVSRHSDISAITLLQQGDVAGLEVQIEDDQWIPVPPIPHALILNIGDLLQIISNDKLKSSVHRALATSVDRYSIANFLTPLMDVIIEPAPELCSKANSHPLYTPFRYGDFRAEYVKVPHGGPRFIERYRSIHYPSDATIAPDGS